MFKKTIAVGPLEPVASCVTGGTAVANPFRCCLLNPEEMRAAGRSNCCGRAKERRRAIPKLSPAVVGSDFRRRRLERRKSSNEISLRRYL
jgi:hypothetical protein